MGQVFVFEEVQVVQIAEEPTEVFAEERAEVVYVIEF